MSNTSFPQGTILGYPRIGRRRELKKYVEAYWAGKLTADELEDKTRLLREDTYRRLMDLGLDADNYSIPESFSYYDQVLDAAVHVGVVPKRFASLLTDDQLDLKAYFTLARGDSVLVPLEMTKWFDSNYHYLVPEIDVETEFKLTSERVITQFEQAKEAGVTVRPTLVGPLSFLLLAKGVDGCNPLSRLDDLLKVYGTILDKLAAAGCEWVQLDEPAVVRDNPGIDRLEVQRLLEYTYTVLSKPRTRPSIFVAMPYGNGADMADALAATAVEAIGFDLVRGSLPLANPALADKFLAGGVLDGRNIWRGDLAAAYYKLERLRQISPNVSVSTSTSLFHLPHDVEDEPNLDSRLKSWLAFADQKIAQAVILEKGLKEGSQAIDTELNSSMQALADRMMAPGVRDGKVRQVLAELTDKDFTRAPYEKRAEACRLDLPLLPTTSIGSFPQTKEIRSARARLKSGALTQGEYDALMREEIQRVVALQEELEMDVLVHGEPERNDMVQYFAELLEGFAVTDNGWVQSYGSRCTRPSILWGDVARKAPMTVDWSVYAQSLTAKPMKGMLTGPVTILAWSFVRDDQPLGDTANQVALALRDEIDDLQRAGISVIQVDEPALRELLPLSEAEHEVYLEWSTRSFRLATAVAKPEVQIHTHLCYSEFGEVIEAIDALEADVTSIEAARSKMEILADLSSVNFGRGIGPGVYDIHSPRVPSQAEMEEFIAGAVQAVDRRRLWVNPDCGLKTRGYEEVVQSLRNMVAAAKEQRAKLS